MRTIPKYEQAYLLQTASTYKGNMPRLVNYLNRKPLRAALKREVVLSPVNIAFPAYLRHRTHRLGNLIRFCLRNVPF
jgi:hypothetical protein